MSQLVNDKLLLLSPSTENSLSKNENDNGNTRVVLQNHYDGEVLINRSDSPKMYIFFTNRIYCTIY